MHTETRDHRTTLAGGQSGIAHILPIAHSHDAHAGARTGGDATRDRSAVKFKEEKRMRRRPTEEELDHFLESAEPRVRPLFGFIRETGCRLSESLRAQHEHINRDQRFVVFTDGTKSGKFRVVSLTDEALRWVDEMPRHATCPYVF
jgi:integrase